LARGIRNLGKFDLPVLVLIDFAHIRWPPYIISYLALNCIFYFATADGKDSGSALVIIFTI
jgi:hypothetical protein